MTRHPVIIKVKNLSCASAYVFEILHFDDGIVF